MLSLEAGVVEDDAAAAADSASALGALVDERERVHCS